MINKIAFAVYLVAFLFLACLLLAFLYGVANPLPH